MLSRDLQKNNCDTHQASGDADLLIVQKAVQFTTTNNTVLVTGDTDLIVLLCFHVSLEFQDLFFHPVSQRTQSADSGEKALSIMEVY